MPGPDFAVKTSRLSNVGVETSRKPNDSASWTNRDSTKRRFAMSSGPQSLVPRGRSNTETPRRGWATINVSGETVEARLRMLSQYCDASRSASGRRSRSRELASPRRHSFSEFRTRAGRVRLDLPEGPASGLRVYGGPPVALDLPDAAAAASEGPEAEGPIPPNR